MPQDWREKAEMARRLAAGVTRPADAARLLEAADEFDRWASEAEAQERAAATGERAAEADTVPAQPP